MVQHKCSDEQVNSMLYDVNVIMLYLQGFEISIAAIDNRLSNSIIFILPFNGIFIASKNSITGLVVEFFCTHMVDSCRLKGYTWVKKDDYSKPKKEWKRSG